MQLNAFSSTVEAIYGAAVEGAGWRPALGAIESLTGCVGAVINFVPRAATTLPITVAGRFTLEQCAQYSQDYSAICRRIAYSLAHPEVPIHYDSMVISENEMDRDPVYAWLATHGLRYYIGASLGYTKRYMIYTSLQRSAAQGHVQASDIRLFSLVIKHLARASALAESLGALEARKQLSLEYLDRLPQALMALAGDGRLLFANRAAEALLGDGTALACVNGHVVACLHGERARLQSLIAEAARPLHKGGGGWMRLRPQGDGPPLALFASAIDLRDEGIGGTRRCVLLTATDPARTPGLDPAALGQLFGLTAAEARVACMLADPEPGGEHGPSLGIAAETLKSHLKAIYRKLDVHRRQDVVQIVTSLAASTGHPPDGG